MTLSEYFDYPLEGGHDALVGKYGKVGAITMSRKMAKLVVALEQGIHADLSVEYRVHSDYNMLSFGGFLAVESALKNVRDIKSRYILILEQVLRPRDEDNWDDLGESWRKKMMDVRAEDALHYVGEILKSREQFHGRLYRDVFFRELEEWEKKQREEEDYTPPSASEMSWEENWYWYSIIHELADGNVLRYEDILRQPMALIAPEWSYRVGRAKIERQRMAEQEALAKARARR